MFGVVSRPRFSTGGDCAACCVQDVVPVSGFLRDISVCCFGVLRTGSQYDDGDVFRRLLHLARQVDNYGNAAFGWDPEGVWDVFAFLYQWANVATAWYRPVFFAGSKTACCFGVRLRLACRFAGSDRLLGVLFAGVDAVQFRGVGRLARGLARAVRISQAGDPFRRYVR